MLVNVIVCEHLAPIQLNRVVETPLVVDSYRLEATNTDRQSVAYSNVGLNATLSIYLFQMVIVIVITALYVPRQTSL